MLYLRLLRIHVSWDVTLCFGVSVSLGQSEPLTQPHRAAAQDQILSKTALLISYLADSQLHSKFLNSTNYKCHLHFDTQGI
jgi:hypothetical protein